MSKTRHGLAKHPLYQTWYLMISRCEDPRHVAYARYGGRDITVCPGWHDVAVFITWIEQNLGPRPEGKTLDRYPNNDGNYEPGNVRWATRAEQANNRGGATEQQMETLMENNQNGTHALLARWDAWGERQTWQKVLATQPDAKALAERKLAELESATALDALAANAELVSRMTGWRWIAIKAAREDGATWEEIGEALGTTKQGAQVAYRRAIEAQEKYAPDLHDTAAARAVLGTED